MMAANVLDLILLFACYCGYAFLFRTLLGVPYLVGPAVSVGAVMTVLFVADFAGILETATFTLYSIGWAGLAYLLYQRLATRTVVAPAGMTLPLVLVAVSFLWLYRLKLGGGYRDWDEFSHWGTVIKAIFTANTFHFNPNPLYFQDYPPGTGLFSYFVLKLLGYSEGNAYFAYNLILLAFCLPIAGLIWRHGGAWLAAGVMLILFLLSRKGLGFGWSTTLIDHILSVMFGGTIAAYLVLRREMARLWPLSVMLAALVLGKYAGQSLAMLAVAVFAVDTLVCQTVCKSPLGLRHRLVAAMPSVAFVAIGLLVLPLTAGWSWRHYVAENELTTSFSQVSVSDLVTKSKQCCSSARDTDIATGFVDKWLGLPFVKTDAAGSLSAVLSSHFVSRLGDITASRGLSPALLFALFLAAGLGGALKTKDVCDRARLLAASAILSSGALAFGLTQLLFYLYVLSDYEARALASFNRFQNTYYLGWGLAVIAFLATVAKSRLVPRYELGRLQLATLALFAVLPFLTGTGIFERLKLATPTMTSERAAIREWAIPRLTALPQSARLYIVWQGTTGLEFWMIRHEALPRKANSLCFSLGSPHFPGDVWSCPRTGEELATEWADYDFIVVGHGLADLKSNYPALLAPVPDRIDRGVLRVQRSDGISGISLALLPDASQSAALEAGVSR